ncbi:alcohol dehydrogenase [Candidatus Aerophobetes bacterium Ae_b3b]|nr:MAG: alcohol dehydrogenase [Candidatus Aerophobetes bacterium Ae_b3b]
MKTAFFYGKEDIRIHEINIPKIKEDEILIRVRVCGICGSDVRSYYKGVEGRYKIPLILGHEVSGQVFKIGGKIDNFAIGNRVAVAPIYGCGKCDFCLSGQENLCKDVMVFGCNLDGAFAEYMKIPAQAIQRGALVKIPDELSDEEAALIEPFSCCLHGVLRANIRPGDTVLVIGAGPIGLAHTKLLRLLGTSYIIASDVVDSRLEVAKKFGADMTINPQREDSLTKIKELTENKGVDAVIVAVGNPEAITQGLKMVRRGGTVVLFGGCPSNTVVQVDPNLIHYSDIAVVGSIDATIDEFRRTVSLVSIAEVKPFITHRFPLESIKDAMEMSKSREALKVAIKF